MRDLSTYKKLQVAELFFLLWDEPRKVGIFF